MRPLPDEHDRQFRRYQKQIDCLNLRPALRRGPKPDTRAGICLCLFSFALFAAVVGQVYLFLNPR